MYLVIDSQLNTEPECQAKSMLRYSPVNQRINHVLKMLRIIGNPTNYENVIFFCTAQWRVFLQIQLVRTAL